MKRQSRIFAGERAWFPDARFGMFIHFGLYALDGIHENVFADGLMTKTKYESKIHRFNPKRFNADEWVRIARDGGARYMVLTSKHGEGFCLWDSRQTSYKITKTPFGRDLVKELADACHRHHMRFGLYFSCSDFHYEEPGEGTPEGKTFQDYAEAQLRELLTQYGKIDLIWFDSCDQRLDLRWMKRIVAMIHRLQPSCVVNDRGLSQRANPYADYSSAQDRSVPNREILDRRHFCFETCDAMGQFSWGYCRHERFWSVPELVKRLSLVSSLGGNYLLNVEPMPDGRIRPECVKRMLEIGRWLKNNGEAVFGAQACPALPKNRENITEVETITGVVPNATIGVSTRRNNTIYLHLHEWPEKDAVMVENISGTAKTAGILGAEIRLKAEKKSTGLLITGIPCKPVSTNTAVIKVAFSGPVKVEREQHCRFFNSFKFGGSRYYLDSDVIDVQPRAAACLPAAAADLEAVNGLPHYVLHRFPDHSIWIVSFTRYNDQIVWRMRVVKSGRYDLYTDIRTIEGQQDSVMCARVGSSITKSHPILLGGSWQHPRRIKIGRLYIPSGRRKLILDFSAMPHGNGPDIKTIILKRA